MTRNTPTTPPIQTFPSDDSDKPSGDSTSNGGASQMVGGGLHRFFQGLPSTLYFLFPLSRAPLAHAAGGTSRMVPWIVPLGLVVGLIWVGCFRMTWWLYGETAGIRFIPGLTIVLVECLLTGPFLVLGLARTVHLLTGTHPRQSELDRASPLSPVGSLVLSLIVLAEWVLIAGIQVTPAWWPTPDDWRHYFNFMYPQPIYRPLLLAPIWGRWGILLGATIGRTARHADTETLAIVDAMRPTRLLRHTLLPVALTIIYCSRSSNFLTGLLVSILVFAMTYFVSVAMARRGGGQTRQSLYAVGLMAQLSFLAIYRALWRLIEG